MLKIHPQYVVNYKQRRKSVLLSIAEWEQILEELEELEDIRAYDAAKEASQESVPFK